MKIINNNNKRFYFLSIAALAVLSAYPLVNGVRMAVINSANGVLEPEQYAKYVVPYAAICVAILFFAALAPVFQKLKRIAFPIGIAAAYGVFFAVGRYFESMEIRVAGMTLIDPATLSTIPDAAEEIAEAAGVAEAADVSGMNLIDAPALSLAPDAAAGIIGAAGGAEAGDIIELDLWQAVLCIASPDIQQQSLTYKMQDTYYYVMDDPSYKVHYYLISLVLITMVCGLVYGIAKAIRNNDATKTKPILLRGVSTAVLVALCVFANMTAFFRQADPIQTPLASFLTGLFFVMLGATVGVYAGSYLLGKGKKIGIGAPVLLSLCVTVMMYIGEAVMMNANLYRFGTGWFFTGLPDVVLAPADIMIVLLAGVATWLILVAARKRETAEPVNIKLTDIA